jgi:hypothetical protein
MGDPQNHGLIWIIWGTTMYHLVSETSKLWTFFWVAEAFDGACFVRKLMVISWEDNDQLKIYGWTLYFKPLDSNS